MSEPHKWEQDQTTDIGGICVCGQPYGVVEHCPNPWRDQFAAMTEAWTTERDLADRLADALARTGDVVARIVADVMDEWESRRA